MNEPVAMEELSVSRWVSTSRAVPKPQRIVLGYVRLPDDTALHLRVFWVARHSQPALEGWSGSEVETDVDGQQWIKAGWYEQSALLGQARLPADWRVTHWLRFPDAPLKVYGMDYGPGCE